MADEQKPDLNKVAKNNIKMEWRTTLKVKNKELLNILDEGNVGETG